jgi:Amt family ammonium transporter
MLIDYLRGRKATAIGAATAIVVGAVGITPAAGFISPMSAILLGGLAAIPSYALIVWRPRTRLDETLDVLAAHGLAGFTGILFIGLFAQASWNLTGNGLLFGSPIQLGRQAIAAAAAPLYAFCGTFILLKLMGLVMRIRVHERDEGQGLDVGQHGEEAYTRGEGAILIRPEHAFELEYEDSAK